MLPINVNPLLMTRDALWAKSIRNRDREYKKHHERREHKRKQRITWKTKQHKTEDLAPEIFHNTWKPSMEWRISQETQEDPSKMTLIERRLFLRAWGLSMTEFLVSSRLDIPVESTKRIASHLGLHFTDLNQIHEEMALKLYLRGMKLDDICKKMHWHKSGVRRAITKAYRRRWDPTQADIMVPWLPPPADLHEVRIIHALRSDDRLWCEDWKTRLIAKETYARVKHYMFRAIEARKVYDRHHENQGD